MQHAAFHVHLVEFHAAGLRHAEAMAEHQKQQATVADLVSAALGRLNQPFDLARGEVLPVADLQHPPPVFTDGAGRRSLVFSPVYHFVESVPDFDKIFSSQCLNYLLCAIGHFNFACAEPISFTKAGSPDWFSKETVFCALAEMIQAGRIDRDRMILLMASVR
jgi:hypothetical protein